MLSKPVKPKLAASVILLRNIPPNSEILMIKRHKNMKFLGGFHAFPGGKMEFDDQVLNDINYFENNFSNESRRFFQIENKDIETKLIHALYITAIRELFEEVGVLLVTNEEDQLINLEIINNLNKIIELRKKLLTKESKFSQILNDNKLKPIYHHLKPFKHFITPEISPIRYDTYFFTLKMPQNQKVLSLSKEIEDYRWLEPKEALKKYNQGEIKLIPPQLACITDLKKLNR
ncbi:MAG: hypothetical protein EAX96_00895 [Candidatus Lokiarchaeota archaeon]|nr:hypothetical protein [Candidatus Lokiarchaeota archaeon]